MDRCKAVMASGNENNQKFISFSVASVDKNGAGRMARAFQRTALQ
jgi:hypothetical protein